jgi:DHA1 family quinolone resistance protein-like MFS transporter
MAVISRNRYRQGSVGKRLTHRRLLVVYSVHQTLHWFATGLIVPILALLQLEKGLNLFHIGLTVAVYSGTIIALELPTGGLADSIGRKKVYVYSLLIRSIGITVLLFAHSFLPVIIGFLFFGAYSGESCHSFRK